MTEKEVNEISWTAVFIGFGVDWMFSELVGLVVMASMLILKGVNLDSEDAIPSDVMLARQIVGVLGALIGGMVAGYIARRRGALHGVLGSVMGLIVVFCSILMLGGESSDVESQNLFTVGDLGFIVLNFVAAGQGGEWGERWRARREVEG